MFATRTGNTVYFYHEGGVDIGDVDSKAERVNVDITGTLTEQQANSLVSKVAEDKKRLILKDVRISYLGIIYFIQYPGQISTDVV